MPQIICRTLSICFKASIQAKLGACCDIYLLPQAVLGLLFQICIFKLFLVSSFFFFFSKFDVTVDKI